eukprot:482400-Pleurochrysis_carterae.AAC.2
MRRRASSSQSHAQAVSRACARATADRRSERLTRLPRRRQPPTRDEPLALLCRRRLSTERTAKSTDAAVGRQQGMWTLEAR